MATLADSLVSSASRSLSLRKRPDLKARRHRYHGKTFWVVKEPIGLNYYRFHEEEYAILNMLNGHVSMEQIKEEFEREFTPQKITFQDLQQFVGMLHRSGLVISDSVGQGRQLRHRRDEKKRKETLQKFSNVFALRWRGIDPERILNFLYPYTAWFFSKTAAFFCILLMVSALGLIAVQWDVFHSRLPTFHEFFGPHNWIYLAITMGLVKILHEFGHGLSCKHFGGECHELGAMLLVFTPALYCNVSDSWMLPNKWHRAFIGAAGMYVEGVIAAICTFIWWFTVKESLLNEVCLSTMFICSVSTLLFNGNPLLRFDGYYILMDITEIPNLRQKSTEVLRRFMTELCLGIEQPENPFLPQKNRFIFGLYTIAAVAYRWIVVFSILLFLNAVLEPYGLQVIGRVIGAIGFFGLIVQPLVQLVKFFYLPGRMHNVKKHRAYITIGVLAAIILFVVTVPLPFHVPCTLELKPSTVESVYASVPGILVSIEDNIEPGASVKQDDPIATMRNLDLEIAVEQLAGELAEREAQLRSLERENHEDRNAGLQIPVVEERIQTLREELAEKWQEIDKLKVKSPINGTVIPPPHRPDRGNNSEMLTAWSGTPFESKNRGALLAETDLICQVGDPSEMEAVLVIDQTDIDLVNGAIDRAKDVGEKGVDVDIKLDAFRWETFSSQVEDIARSSMQHASQRLAVQGGGELETRSDPSTGGFVPISTSYQASAKLENPNGLLRTGLTGRGKIYTGWMPLGSRLYRWAAKTFHFDM